MMKSVDDWCELAHEAAIRSSWASREGNRERAVEQLRLAKIRMKNALIIHGMTQRYSGFGAMSAAGAVHEAEGLIRCS
jgi:hypothetical protein